MTDQTEEEALRQAFIQDEGNLDLASNDLAEAIRELLRALAAKDPSGPASRAVATLRSLLRIYGADLPTARVLHDAIAKLTDLDQAQSRHGAIVDTAGPALAYFAELTATDEMAHLRLSKAHVRYNDAVRSIDEINKLRREMREL